MPITAIQPRRLYQQVAEQLRALIEGGEFAIGDRLPSERDLAEQLGISRPTVREALIALEVEGRIRIRVGSGIFVAAPKAGPALTPGSIEGPFELLRARALIEGALVQEAATLASSADIALLDALLAQMEGGAHASQATIDLDREFHCAIAGILGNAVLVRFIGELFDQRINPFFERLSTYFENDHTWSEALIEHRAVRDAIAAGDGEAAKAAMRRHLQESQKRFSRNFGEGAGAEERAAFA
ncbi:MULTISPECIES: FadR/GntR family transcriptional regulator [unclassified Aureimonas]|uniref:FadR/GntR family transcriptional regulator n=1 Tax=unclassified Aureimonas TaxID=2615206 RepID=UPI0006F7C573|nr:MULTISPECIES: FadR/GntR family transcriptional regulator [unclassified Aureimonas]KQT60684.1 GntR family transcriptional regulator [Aureimonas sp. Leaf460]KQT68813.1 GntR family transcriptional regulator [Aureimonas sp. Leaf427]